MIDMPLPDQIATQSISTRVDRQEARLGDNYVRVARNGRNSTTDILRVTWNPASQTDTDTIFNALRGTDSVDPVNHTVAGESTQRSWLLVPGSLSKSYRDQLNQSISASFEERHLP